MGKTPLSLLLKGFFGKCVLVLLLGSLKKCPVSFKMTSHVIKQSIDGSSSWDPRGHILPLSTDPEISINGGAKKGGRQTYGRTAAVPIWEICQKKTLPPFPPPTLSREKQEGGRRPNPIFFAWVKVMLVLYARHISAKFDTFLSSFAFNMWIWVRG